MSTSLKGEKKRNVIFIYVTPWVYIFKGWWKWVFPSSRKSLYFLCFKKNNISCSKVLWRERGMAGGVWIESEKKGLCVYFCVYTFLFTDLHGNFMLLNIYNIFISFFLSLSLLFILFILFRLAKLEIEINLNKKLWYHFHTTNTEKYSTH